MDALSNVNLAIHLVTALITGGAAGGVVYAGIIYKQKETTMSIRRTERFVTWAVQVILQIAERHNDIHPEAKVDVSGLGQLLYDATGRDAYGNKN